MGRPPSLSWAEERALVGYIVVLSRGLFPGLKHMALQAANELRAARTPPAPCQK